MKTTAIVYNFDKLLNLDKLHKEIRSLKPSTSPGALSVDIDNLRLFVLPNGIIRLTVPGGDMPALFAAVKESGKKANAVIQEVATASGQALPKDIKMDVEHVDGKTVIDHPYEDFRPHLGSKADIRVVNSVVMSVFEMLGEFEAKRVQVQAGEYLGRAIAKEIEEEHPGQARPEELDMEPDYKKLYEHVSRRGQELGLGILSLQTTVADHGSFLHTAGHVSADLEKRHHPTVHEAVLDEAYFAGLMVYGKPTCDIVRGLLRGAFCQYTGLETMFVEETECWGKGDTRCRFMVSPRKI